MSRKNRKTKDIWVAVAEHAFSSYDGIMDNRYLLLDFAKSNVLESFERDMINGLIDIASCTSLQSLKFGRSKCLQFMKTLEAPEINDYDYDDDDLNIETQENIQRKKARSFKLKNDRVNSFRRNNNQHYRIKAKRNACRTSRKYRNKKSLNNDSEMSGQKDSKCTNLANSVETSQSDAEEIQFKKFYRRQSLKRKAEMIDKLCLKEDNRTLISDITSINQTRRKRNTNRNTIIDLNSINEPVKLKDFEIRVIDFMNDLSADTDPYIAEFKQAHSFKTKGCGLENNKEVFNDLGDVEVFKVVDDTVADVGFDQNYESDIDLDKNEDDENHDDDHSFKSPETKDVDNDDDHSFKSPETKDVDNDDDIEQESTLTQATAVSHQENVELKNVRSSGSCTPPSSTDLLNNVERGPQSPPSVSCIAPSSTDRQNHLGRGPRTPPAPSPSSSPRTRRSCSPPTQSVCPRESCSPSTQAERQRGPRTPPGVAPTSDSEASDDEVCSDSSTISTAY